jgi:glycosyltransferase involved in cell wall biosynthesis
MVLTSGRLWDAGKNLAALDDAAARMTSEVFAAGPLEGPGGEAVSLRAVRPLGPLSPAAHARALDEALVFVSLSLYEPFGLGVLEAAQSGCALALSDIPSFRELWEGAAVFVDSADPEAAARALDALAQDRDQALRLGRLAEAKARAYSAEAMSARMRALYGGLLDARLAGAAA